MDEIYSIAAWLERLTASDVVATVLDSIPASSDTVESEGRPDEAVLNIVHKKKKKAKKSPVKRNWSPCSTHQLARKKEERHWQPVHTDKVRSEYGRQQVPTL